jgi:hypothetical protein
MAPPVAPVLLTLLLLGGILAIAYTLRLILLVPPGRGIQPGASHTKAPRVESCDSPVGKEDGERIAPPRYLQSAPLSASSKKLGDL